MQFFLLKFNQHRAFVMRFIICIFNNGGCSFLGLVKDGLLHLLNSLLDISCYHNPIFGDYISEFIYLIPSLIPNNLSLMHILKCLD